LPKNGSQHISNIGFKNLMNQAVILVEEDVQEILFDCSKIGNLKTSNLFLPVFEVSHHIDKNIRYGHLRFLSRSNVIPIKNTAVH